MAKHMEHLPWRQFIPCHDLTLLWVYRQRICTLKVQGLLYSTCVALVASTPYVDGRALVIGRTKTYFL